MTLVGLTAALVDEAKALAPAGVSLTWRHEGAIRLAEITLPDASGGMLIACAGPGPEGGAAAARLLVARGASLLVAAGVAGGLAPALRPGHVLLAGAVHGFNHPPHSLAHAEESPELHEVHPGLRERLAAGLGQRGLTVHHGDLASLTGPLGRPEAKAGLHARCGALAVEMESAAAACVARAAGVPFAALRTVVDAAEHHVPELFATALDTHGRPQVGRILLGLARQPLAAPGLVAEALRLRARYQAALASLALVGGACLDLVRE